MAEAGIARHTIASPIGPLYLAASATGLRELRFGIPAGQFWQSDAATGEAEALLAMVERQLSDYFSGERQRFDLPLDAQGTPFQRGVWQALRRIPYGETRTYQAIADLLGTPKACRAVGAANGANPISIVVPCHRVVGSSGRLTGFAGGLEAKRFLLNLEAGTGFVLTAG